MQASLASMGSLNSVTMYYIASLISALSSDPTPALSMGTRGAVQLRVSGKTRIERSSLVSDHAKRCLIDSDSFRRSSRTCLEQHENISLP